VPESDMLKSAENSFLNDESGNNTSHSEGEGGVMKEVNSVEGEELSNKGGKRGRPPEIQKHRKVINRAARGPGATLIEKWTRRRAKHVEKERERRGLWRSIQKKRKNATHSNPKEWIQVGHTEKAPRGRNAGGKNPPFTLRENGKVFALKLVGKELLVLRGFNRQTDPATLFRAKKVHTLGGGGQRTKPPRQTG